MELLNSKGQLLDDLRRGIQLVAPDLKLVSKTTGFIAESFADKTTPVIALQSLILYDKISICDIL